MRFSHFEFHRQMRGRLHAALRKGRLALFDIGSSKIACLVLRIAPERLSAAAENGQLDTAAFAAAEVAGASLVQARGVRRGEIIDMEETSRAVRQALLAAEKMAAPKVGRVDHALVALSGGRPRSFSTMAEVEVETGRVEERDIARAMAACPTPPIGENRRILHAQPVEIALDGQTGITDPRGMTGQVLGLAMHVVTVDARSVDNLRECMRHCDLDLAGIVAAPYAAGLAALVEDEQRAGAICIDMGAGSTSFSIFLREHPMCVGQVRYGGNHVSNDIAAGLMMRTAAAERLKTLHGGVVPTGADDHDLIDAPRIGEEESPARRQISRGTLIGVIRPRVEEILRLLRQELADMGVGELPRCSVVLTGGASQLAGVDELVTDILGRRPRMGRPLRISGLPQALAGPAASAVVGLAIYALAPHDELWDFEAPRSLSARGRATEILRWFSTSW